MLLFTLTSPPCHIPGFMLLRSTCQALPLTSQDLMEARPPWMVGTPQLLTPDDTSPFYELAPIPPGEMQFSVDTPTFRSDQQQLQLVVASESS